jgi:hypothetical protein
MLLLVGSKSIQPAPGKYFAKRGCAGAVGLQNPLRREYNRSQSAPPNQAGRLDHE